jgi:hypothetical protein
MNINNNTFSSERLMMLFRSSLLINKRLILITLAGVAGTIFLVLLLLQMMNGYKNWSQQEFLVTFIVLFFLLGAVYTSLSFPAFRSGVRTVNYLMLPASTLEKFIFELSTRVVLFIVIMPVLYWLVANIEAKIVYNLNHLLERGYFSFREGSQHFVNQQQFKGWALVVLIQCLFVIFTATFAGSAYFTKSPLIKTFFTLSLIIGFYLLYTWLLIKGLKMDDYIPTNHRVLFIHNEKDFQLFMALGMTVVNVLILTISWFFLKEKEA